MGKPRWIQEDEIGQRDRPYPRGYPIILHIWQAYIQMRWHTNAQRDVFITMLTLMRFLVDQTSPPLFSVPVNRDIIWNWVHWSHLIVSLQLECKSIITFDEMTRKRVNRSCVYHMPGTNRYVQLITLIATISGRIIMDGWMSIYVLRSISGCCCWWDVQIRLLTGAWDQRRGSSWKP